MDTDLQKILARQREVAAQIEKLRVEAEELETAIRVFKRYAGPNGAAAGGPKLGPARPEGVPSLYDMTVSVLRDAVGSGKPGLTGNDIVAAIAKRYWPGLKGQQVLPSIYAFAKHGRLVKNHNGVFRPPQV